VVEKIKIDTLDVPGVEPYRSMKWQYEQRQQGIFVAEGEKVVRRLLESDLTVVSALLLERWFIALEPLLLARPENIRVYIAERPLLETMIGFAIYQGVLAVGLAPKPPTLSDILERAKGHSPLLVAVEGVSSAENMGGLARNCAAFGVDGLIAGETSCSPYLRRSVRASMGTIFKMPAIEAVSLVEVLRELKKLGIRCVAAHPHTDQRRISDANLREPTCIVLGAEGNGLSAELLEACDEAVLIPMQGGVDSLNVGTAGAVFLYEAARQRGLV
jgi:tRNA G18 (ribose-2'-O)-methylase SpoU